MDRWDTFYDTMEIANLFESRGGRVIELCPHQYGFKYSGFEGRFKLKPDVLEGKMWDAFSSGHALSGLITEDGLQMDVPLEDVRRYNFRTFSFKGGAEQAWRIFALADMPLEEYIRSITPVVRQEQITDCGPMHFLPFYTWYSFVSSAPDEDRDSMGGYGCLLECFKLGIYYAAFRLLDIVL